MKRALRTLSIVVALTPLACAPAAAPSSKTPSVASPKVELRYAAQPPRPPAFVDPERAQKLAALLPVLEKRIDAFFANEKPPSVAVAMVVDGQVVLTRVLGVRDKDTKAPATERTLYRIGSVTKPFTATLVLALRDEGLLTLDAPAERWLPELARVTYPFRDAPRMTLRHLLTHTSGLPRLGDFDYTGEKDVTREVMLGALERTRVEHAPGSHYVYSNFGMSLVGELVARVAPEHSYRAAMAKRVTGPLGMTSTTFDPGSGAELASGYEGKNDDKPAKPWHLGASEAAGGLWSSLADMSKWIAWQLAAWPPRDAPEAGPISRASLREAHVPGFGLGLTARLANDRIRANSTAIGLGWHTRESCAYEHVVEHSGAIDGFHASVGFAPDRGFGFVVLASSNDTPTEDLRAAFFDEAAKALAKREMLPALETVAMLDDLAGTFATCSEADHGRILTESFRRKVPFDKWARVCHGFGKLHGACKRDKTLSLDHPRSGRFRLACERGAIEANAAIIDQDGKPRFDSLLIRSMGIAPAKSVLKAADDALGLYAKWDAGRFKALFAKTDREKELKEGFDKVRPTMGACKLAPDAATDGGDGERSAVVHLACEKSDRTDLLVDLDDNGKITSLLFRPGAGPKESPRCVDPPAKPAGQ